jgi:hypothetical protein
LGAVLFDAVGAASAEAESEDVFVGAPPFDEGDGPEEEEEGVKRGVFVCVGGGGGGGVGGQEREEEAESRREDKCLCV